MSILIFNFSFSVKNKGHSRVLVYFPYIGVHFTMLAIIMVHLFLELIINFRVPMTGHDVVHMESHYLFLARFYPVSDIWIIRIELKSNLLQVSTKFLVE